MDNLSVVGICLTKDRPEMTQRAVDCFLTQTHPKKRLLVYDTSEVPPEVYPKFDAANVLYFWAGQRTLTIGGLRNEAIEFAQMAACPGQFDIVAHFDSDDLSHPNRIAEQVQLLQSSGADAVGYSECLFWREPPKEPCDYCEGGDCCAGEAWLYTSTSQNEAIGSSLCYWRKTWERKPFQPTSQGEDAAFQIGLKVKAISSLPFMRRFPSLKDPLLLCRIHSGNTSNSYTAENMRAAEWRRVVEWDGYCRKEFAR